MKKNLTYETPEVEVIEVEVEEGFSSSLDGVDPDADIPGYDPWG